MKIFLWKPTPLIFSSPENRGLLFGLLLFQTFPVFAVMSLEQMSLEELMNVSIVGASKYEQKQNQVAAAVSVISRQDIRTYGWRTLGEALASLPGIYNTYNYQYDQLGTRGLGLPGDFNTRVLVTINGNRINDVTYDQGPSGRDFPLDIDMIERIEFIPGPGSAVYGQNAMMGVVNVITRNGSAIQGVEISTSRQTAEVMTQKRVTMGKLFDNGLDALISVSGLQSRGEDRFFDYGSSGISGVAQRMDGENNKQYFARASLGSVAFDFVYGNRRKEDPTALYFSDPLVPGAYVQDRRLNTQIQYNDNFANETLNVLGRLYFGQYHYDNPLFYSGDKSLLTGYGNWYGSELRLLSTALTAHKLMAGVEYMNATDIHQTYQNFADATQNVAIHSVVTRVGVYAQDEWRITDTLSATAGLRYDHNSWIGYRLSPRGALIWQATPKLVFKTLYGRAHRAPNSFERDYADGVSQVANTRLRSEAVDTTEFVTDYQALPNTRLRASAYSWDMSNVVTLGVDPISGLSQYQQSNNKLLARGVELSSDTTWDWGGRLRASYGIQNVEQQGVQIPNSPYHLGKLNISMPVPVITGLQAGYELQYYGERRTLNGTRVDSAVLSNLNLISDVRWVKG